MIEYSLDLLFGKETWLIKKLHHSNKTKFEKSGLICGGFQTIIFNVIDKSYVQIIENILSSISQKAKWKTLQLFQVKLNISKAEKIHQFHFHYNSDEDWQYTENIRFTINCLHCWRRACWFSSFKSYEITWIFTLLFLIIVKMYLQLTK